MERHQGEWTVDGEPTDERSNASAAALSNAGWSRPASAPLGFKIQGAAASDNLGSSVAHAGDINGDGIDDLIIGAPGVLGTGAAYVVFGSNEGFPALIDLGQLVNGKRVLEIRGDTPNYFLGASVSSAGDVNNDGIDDFLIGAPPRGNSPNGAAYLVFGSNVGFGSLIDEIEQPELGGSKIEFSAGFDSTGFSVSSAGDVNGDGIDDFIIGIPTVDFYNTTGAAYVIFGVDDQFPSSVDLQEVSQGRGGFRG